MEEERHFENGFIAISAGNQIWCADTNVHSKNGPMTKYWNFAHITWRLTAIFEIVFHYISTIYCPMNAKFSTK